MRLRNLNPWITVGLLLLSSETCPMTTGFPQHIREITKFERPMRVFDLHNYETPMIKDQKREAVSGISDELGGEWRVFSWNPQTHTPRYVSRYVYGSGVSMADDLASDRAVESAARDIIDRLSSVLKADSQKLQVIFIQRGFGKVSIHFQQLYASLEVLGGTVHLVFTDDGRLFELGSDFYSGIELSTAPQLPLALAEGGARDDLPFNPATDLIMDGSRLVILPVGRSCASVDMRLAWEIRVRTEDPVGIWRTYVDANTGEILSRTNEVSFDAYGGTVRGLYEPWTACDDGVEAPLPYAHVTVSNGMGFSEGFADENAEWSLSIPGSGLAVVSAGLQGEKFVVRDCDGDPNCSDLSSDGAATGLVGPGDDIRLFFQGEQKGVSGGNSRWSERDVYVHLNRARQYYHDRVDSDFVGVNQRVTVHVDKPIFGPRGCGGLYSSGLIELTGRQISVECSDFLGGKCLCRESGRFASTIIHEYGHHIYGKLNKIISNVETGLNEGNASVLAMLVSIRPSWGADRCDCSDCGGGPPANDYADNDLAYPGDLVPHERGANDNLNGRPLAGFYWHSMEHLSGALGADSGEILEEARVAILRLWHWGISLMQPKTQIGQVYSAFIADDDDGNLLNGTPTYGHLAIGAESHGYPYPDISEGVLIHHDPLQIVSGDGNVEVHAGITSTSGVIDPATVQLHFRVGDGVLETVLMQEMSETDQYVGVIPGLTSPEIVSYYISAADDAGNERAHPYNAPDVLHTFDMATHYDDMEQSRGWAADPDGDDDATSGLWVRLDPNGTIAQPEDDHTLNGTMCWVTGNALPGSDDEAEDVDGGRTTLQSPVYDLTGATSAIVKYRRWYSNDRGENPGSDVWSVAARNNVGDWVALESTSSSWREWVLQGFDLIELFGEGLGRVQIRFVAADEDANSLVEAGVDDFEILAGYGSSAGAEGRDRPVLPVSTYLLGARPNPFSPSTAIRFGLTSRSKVLLQIFDVSGRLVRTLIDGRKEPGHHSVVWSGRDDRGRAAAAGIYYGRLQVGEFSETGKLTLLK